MVQHPPTRNLSQNNLFRDKSRRKVLTQTLQNYEFIFSQGNDRIIIS